MPQPTEQTASRAPAQRDPGREIADQIDHTLEQRSAPEGSWRAHAEEETKRRGMRVWGVLKRRPSIGVVVFGGLAVAAADAVGVGELAMGIAVGYAAWQVLRKGKPVGEALEEAEQLEKA